MKQRNMRRYCRNGHLVEDEQLNFCPECGMPLDIQQDQYDNSQANPNRPVSIKSSKRNKYHIWLIILFFIILVASSVIVVGELNSVKHYFDQVRTDNDAIIPDITGNQVPAFNISGKDLVRKVNDLTQASRSWSWRTAPQNINMFPLLFENMFAYSAYSIDLENSFYHVDIGSSRNVLYDNVYFDIFEILANGKVTGASESFSLDSSTEGQWWVDSSLFPFDTYSIGISRMGKYNLITGEYGETTYGIDSYIDYTERIALKGPNDQYGNEETVSIVVNDSLALSYNVNHKMAETSIFIYNNGYHGIRLDYSNTDGRLINVTND